MAFAQSLMVFILVISFGVLVTVALFWIKAGKLVDDKPQDTTILSTGSWDATTLLLR